MLQYVMTKLETHNINSDGQIMPNHIEQVSSKLIQYLLRKQKRSSALTRFFETLEKQWRKQRAV